MALCWINVGNELETVGTAVGFASTVALVLEQLLDAVASTADPRSVEAPRFTPLERTAAPEVTVAHDGFGVKILAAIRRLLPPPTVPPTGERGCRGGGVGAGPRAARGQRVGPTSPHLA